MKVLTGVTMLPLSGVSLASLLTACGRDTDAVVDDKGGTILSSGYLDVSNKPIIDPSVTGKERQMFGDSADSTSLLAGANLTVTGIRGKAVFAVVQLEYTTRNLAGTGT
jgi:uncharacterized protein